MTDKKPFQFSLRKLLAVVAVVAVLCGILFSIREAMMASRRRAWTKSCVDRLKDFGVRWHIAYEMDGHVPPPSTVDADGKPSLSWRVAYCRSFWRQRDVNIGYDDDLPWDHPKNLAVGARYKGHFACLFSDQPSEKGFTNYVVIVAPENAHNVRPDAIVFAEIEGSGVYWTEPRDLTFEEISVKINQHKEKRHHHPHGAMAVYADGSSRLLEDLTDPEDLRKLLVGNRADAPGVKGRWHYRNSQYVWEPD
jgi:hypothetical protein